MGKEKERVKESCGELEGSLLKYIYSIALKTPLPFYFTKPPPRTPNSAPGTGRELLACRKVLQSRLSHYVFSLKSEDLWRKREQRSRLYLGASEFFVLFFAGCCLWIYRVWGLCVWCCGGSV